MEKTNKSRFITTESGNQKNKVNIRFFSVLNWKTNRRIIHRFTCSLLDLDLEFNSLSVSSANSRWQHITRYDVPWTTQKNLRRFVIISKSFCYAMKFCTVPTGTTPPPPFFFLSYTALIKQASQHRVLAQSHCCSFKILWMAPWSTKTLAF